MKLSRVALFAVAAILTSAIGIKIISGLGTATAQESCPHKPCPLVPGMTSTECKEYKPTDWKPGVKQSWWYDTDGIDPGVAGCHVEVNDPAGSKKGQATGRSFAEGCVDGVTLIESNPASGAVHEHCADVGHPNYVNCNRWCIEVRKAKSGVCLSVNAGPNEPKVAPCSKSARCDCKN